MPNQGSPIQAWVSDMKGLLGSKTPEQKSAALVAKIKAEADAAKRMKLCETYLKKYVNHDTERAEVQDLYASARKDWGVAEAKKAYGIQLEGKADKKYNPDNAHDLKHFEKGEVFEPIRLERCSR